MNEVVPATCTYGVYMGACGGKKPPRGEGEDEEAPGKEERGTRRAKNETDEGRTRRTVSGVQIVEYR
jgi:hypothetical protein